MLGLANVTLFKNVPVLLFSGMGIERVDGGSVRTIDAIKKHSVRHDSHENLYDVVIFVSAAVKVMPIVVRYRKIVVFIVTEHKIANPFLNLLR